MSIDSKLSLTASGRIGTSRALVPLKPPPLAGSRLEMRSNGGDVLPGSNHRASHLVSVCINCNVSVLTLSKDVFNERTRALQEKGTAVESPCLSPAHSITQLV